MICDGRWSGIALVGIQLSDAQNPKNRAPSIGSFESAGLERPKPDTSITESG